MMPAIRRRKACNATRGFPYKVAEQVSHRRWAQHLPSWMTAARLWRINWIASETENLSMQLQQEANAGAGLALSMRLADVERRLWITSIALALAICAGIAGTMMAAGDADVPHTSRAVQPVPAGIAGIERLAGAAPPILRASGLIIVDQNGEERMVFEVNDRGEAVFTVSDVEGRRTYQAP